jgi:hypothetical protein
MAMMMPSWRSRPAEVADPLAPEVGKRLDRRVFEDQHRVHRRKNTEEHQRPFALGARPGHGGQPAVTDIDALLGDHDVQRRRVENPYSLVGNVVFLQQLLALHYRMDKIWEPV